MRTIIVYFPFDIHNKRLLSNELIHMTWTYICDAMLIIQRYLSLMQRLPSNIINTGENYLFNVRHHQITKD
ncbi:hypothetical protein EON73_05775 [bacterium]|nr:MAG: hypothetical protein EON73_05775 [bacterium]